MQIRFGCGASSLWMCAGRGRKIYKARYPYKGMTMLRSIKGRYALRLTDGYIRPKSYDLAEAVGDSASSEKLVADELVRLLKKPYWGLRSKQRQGRQGIHVWVVGAGGWLKRAPELFRLMAENDPGDAYRIVICGEDSSGLDRWMTTNLTPQITYAGIEKRKKHENHRTFKEIGDTLLGMMHDHYRSTGEAPTGVLKQFGVPLQFSGYEPKRADSTFSYRIQQ